MTIDNEGKLWVAFFDGTGGVIRFCPEKGTILEQIKFPCSRVTDCAFGGKDLD